MALIKDQYQLPQLPPLEDVLKLVKNPQPKPEEIDYRAKYEMLQREVENLRSRHSREIEKLKEKTNTEAGITICPILDRETGDGRISIRGVDKIVCEHIYLKPFCEYRCDLTNKKCNYSE